MNSLHVFLGSIHLKVGLHICTCNINNFFHPYCRELATFPNLPTLVSVENDATLAKQACSVGYAYKRRVEQYAHCSHIMNTAVKQLVAVSSF